MSLLRVYLVEDSPLIQASLVDALQELAPVRIVGTAVSEEEAIDWIDHHAKDWDLLVVDIFLKSGSGVSVLRHCQQRDPARKAVVFSNYATADMKRRCSELGADAVFDKSREIDALIDYCAQLGQPAAAPGGLTG